MYEGRMARLFTPCSGVLTWMSNPAQPSFVWQLYHYDLEPNSSLFAVKSAGEPVHIQFNESNGNLEVINNLPRPLTGALARVSIYLLDGALASRYETKVTAEPSSAINLGPVKFPDLLASTHFLKLELDDAEGKIISTNFYWRGEPGYPDVLTDLNSLPVVPIEFQITRKDVEGKRVLTLVLHNPTANIALMTHLQLRRQHSGERVLPVYYSDNYVSLTANEFKTITIEADLSAFKGDDPLLMVDGWNVTVVPGNLHDVEIAPNADAQPDHWPVSGLPFQTVGLR